MKTHPTSSNTHLTIYRRRAWIVAGLALTMATPAALPISAYAAEAATGQDEHSDSALYAPSASDSAGAEGSEHVVAPGDDSAGVEAAAPAANGSQDAESTSSVSSAQNDDTACGAEPAGQNESIAPSAPEQLTALKTVPQYDEEIRALGAATDVAAKISAGTLGEAGELLIMQRWLVANADYVKLLEWANKSPENAQFLQWFMTEPQMLELYVTGGQPGTRPNGFMGTGNASHVRSIQQLMDIARAYPEDIRKNGQGELTADQVVYRKMMISAALGMCDSTHLWTGGKNPAANPVKRYGIIKTLRANAEQYHFQKDIFDGLPVEQMRWIFENRIADEEIPWLVNYSLATVEASNDDDAETRQKKENSRLDAYTFTEYSGYVNNQIGYNNPSFYNQHDLYTQATGIEDHGADGRWPWIDEWKPGDVVEGGWSQKYQFAYSDPNFPNANPTDPFYLSHGTDPTADTPRLWMVFELGGVCGAIAKTSENLSGVSGLPGTVCGQPGHAIALRYEWLNVKKPDGTTERKLGYSIQNDVFGWFETKVPEVSHMLCGWDEVHAEQKVNGQVTDATRRWGGGPMVLMAQDALDDWDNFVKCFELRVLAAASVDADKMAVVDAAIRQQPYNLDATMAKIALMERDGAAADQWIALADDVANHYTYYPIAMRSLMKLIEQKGGESVMGAVEGKRIEALKRAEQATEDQVDQADACRVVAQKLLGKTDGKVASFAFDGENPGTIELGAQFDNSSLEWEYSLDGEKSWKTVAGNTHEVKLSADELASINAADDVRVRLRGVNTVTVIDITEGVAPKNYGLNNFETRIYTREGTPLSSIEAQIDGKWVTLTPEVELPKTEPFVIRSAAAGTTLASAGDQTVTVQFKPVEHVPQDAVLVPAYQLKVNGFSSQQGKAEVAAAAVNGYMDDNEFWHNNYEGDPTPWITIDLGSERTIAYVDYWNRGYNSNGMLKAGEIWVAGEQESLPEDGVVPEDRFEKVQDFAFDWESDPVFGAKGLQRRIAIDEPVRARYIRIRVTDSVTQNQNIVDKGHRYITASEFQFYEAEPRVPSVEVKVGPLGNVVYGYEDVAASDITIKNAGTGPAHVSARVDSDAFEVVAGADTIAPGAVDTSWKVKPARGLAAGEYQATLTVEDGNGKSAAQAISLTVERSPRTVTLGAPVEVRPDGVTLAEAQVDLGADDGVIEYACATSAEEPKDGWQQEAQFDGLKPATEYYFFARVSGGKNHLDAVSAPVRVKTADSDQGGNGGNGGQGGDQGGDNQGGGNNQGGGDTGGNQGGDTGGNQGGDQGGSGDGNQGGNDNQGGGGGQGDGENQGGNGDQGNNGGQGGNQQGDNGGQGGNQQGGGNGHGQNGGHAGESPQQGSPEAQGSQEADDVLPSTGDTTRGAATLMALAGAATAAMGAAWRRRGSSGADAQ